MDLSKYLSKELYEQVEKELTEDQLKEIKELPPKHVLNDKNEEIKNLKEQLKDSEAQLTAVQDSINTIKAESEADKAKLIDLDKQITTYKTDLDAKEAEFNNKLLERDKKDNLLNQMKGKVKPGYEKFIMSEMDLEKLVNDGKSTITGLSEEIARLQALEHTKHGFILEGSAGLGDPDSAEPTKKTKFSEMSFTDKIKLKKSDPEKYEKLKKIG